LAVREKKEEQPMTCTFCRIIRGELPAFILEETADVIVFLSLENHPLVVPKQHISTLYTVEPTLGAAVIEMLVRVANAVKQGLTCDGVYVTQANETAAGQDVSHVHFHVYPRWRDPRIDAFWNTTDAAEWEKQETATRIRQQLQKGKIIPADICASSWHMRDL
jgi:histidine triad (HIT) family protein